VFLHWFRPAGQKGNLFFGQSGALLVVLLAFPKASRNNGAQQRAHNAGGLKRTLVLNVTLLSLVTADKDVRPTRPHRSLGR